MLLSIFLKIKNIKFLLLFLKENILFKKTKKAAAKSSAPVKSASKKKTSATKTASKIKEQASVEKTSAPQQSQQTSSVPSNARMTPLYSIPVTNELFHNGNVEAWKRIIASYKSKYAGLEVLIFYEGERIHDINTLFKWGKVKHGCAILFAVAGKRN